MVAAEIVVDIGARDDRATQAEIVRGLALFETACLWLLLARLPLHEHGFVDIIEQVEVLVVAF